MEELKSINGVYIPGDSKQSFEDDRYLTQVTKIMDWAAKHNADDDTHFPIVGVSWGMLSLLRSQTNSSGLFKELKDHLIGEPLQQNLHLLPKETFIYDEMLGWDLEKTLDEVTFYHEMDEGIKLSDFITAQQLRHFVPVATYDQGKKNDGTGDEMVSTIEGTYYPIFGFSYRIDKVQFGFHASAGEGHEHLDHSRASVEHAQHIANLIVDEARLSSNKYAYTNDETAKLISNYDMQMVTLPSPHNFTSDKEYSNDYRTEIYLF